MFWEKHELYYCVTPKPTNQKPGFRPRDESAKLTAFKPFTKLLVLMQVHACTISALMQQKFAKTPISKEMSNFHQSRATTVW